MEKELTAEAKKAIQSEINRLKNTLTNDFLTDLETKGNIHQLEMKLNGAEYYLGNEEEDCLFCGS